MIKFTIITVCYNAEDSIAKTVGSVLQQTYKNYEYIIVDGASKDNTVHILEEYKNPLMCIYSEPDKGISDAFNKGISYSQGEYLCFLNSGDYFIDKDVLKNVFRDLEVYAEDILSYSVRHVINNFFPKSEEEGKKLWQESIIPHQGSFTKREVFTKVGGFNIYFKIRMDYEFFTRCYKYGITCKCIPRVIACYDSSGISSTDSYHAHKEGLAVRLLHKEQVNTGEINIMRNLVQHDGLHENKTENELENQRRIIDRYYKIMKAMNSWICALQRGKLTVYYFNERLVQSIAIYGWGDLGKCLENELRDTNVQVRYVIDRNKNNIGDKDIKIYSLDDDTWPDVDMVVVTPFYEYQSIKERIKEKINCRIVSIEDIIMGD